MAKRTSLLTGRAFVGGRPYEDLTESERSAFSKIVLERLGRALNGSPSQRPDTYKRSC